MILLSKKRSEFKVMELLLKNESIKYMEEIGEFIKKFFILYRLYLLYFVHSFNKCLLNEINSSWKFFVNLITFPLLNFFHPSKLKSIINILQIFGITYSQPFLKIDNKQWILLIFNNSRIYFLKLFDFILWYS